MSGEIARRDAVEPFDRDSFSVVLGQLEGFVLDLDGIDFADLAEAERRTHLLAEYGRRYKAADEAFMRIGVARIRIARRMGQLLVAAGDGWREVAAQAGVTKHFAGFAKSLGRPDAALFERALADVVASGSVPSTQSVIRRIEAYADPGGMGESCGWRERISDRDWDFGWDERDARRELGEQLAVETAEALNQGRPLTLGDLAELVIGEDPELIIALDPPGHDVMRRRLKDARRGRRDGWPTVFTCRQGVETFTYVSFDHATLGHARAHSSIQRENVWRVLKSYRALRRLLKAHRHLPDEVRLAALGQDESEAAA